MLTVKYGGSMEIETPHGTIFIEVGLGQTVVSVDPSDENAFEVYVNDEKVAG